MRTLIHLFLLEHRCTHAVGQMYISRLTDVCTYIHHTAQLVPPSKRHMNTASKTYSAARSSRHEIDKRFTNMQLLVGAVQHSQHVFTATLNVSSWRSTKIDTTPKHTSSSPYPGKNYKRVRVDRASWNGFTQAAGEKLV